MESRGLDEHRLRRLLEVGRALVSQLDREELLRLVLEVARELTGARYAAIGILDADRVELERFLTVGIDDETHRAIGDLPRGLGILGELIREPKPLRLNDISEQVRSYGFPPAHPPMTTFLGAPVLIRGEAWGNIYLTEKEDGDFDELDEEALVVLAEWVAIAIENARLYEGIESRRRELERAVSGLEATTTLARAIGGETDLTRVLELVVKRGRALIEARVLLVLLGEGDELVVSAAAGETREGIVGTHISTPGTLLADLIRGQHSERLSDVSSRVRLGLGELVDDSSTALLVPLTFRGRPVGVLIALDRLDGGDEFGDEDERVMRAFASSAAMAVATAQTVEADQLRLTIQAAEHERGRWARELHDETLQGLGALQVILTAALQQQGDDAVKQAARQAVNQIAEEIDKLQGLIAELRPAALDDLGLAPALESLVERVRAVHGLTITAAIDLDDEAGGQPTTRLMPEIESTAYRLVQEALTNVAKHARAETVEVVVKESGDELSIEVRDDGRGFELGTRSDGFGLVGMRERVDLVGGEISIESKSGAGTLVSAKVPARHRQPEASTGRPAEAGAA
jgi:signal transduction histidine kinase